MEDPNLRYKTIDEVRVELGLPPFGEEWSQVPLETVFYKPIQQIKARPRWTFFHGVCFSWAANSLFQDWLGQDRFISWASSHWIPAGITVPLALLVLAFIVMDAITKGKR